MERFNDLATWSSAVTISLIKDTATKLGIPLSGRLKSDLLKSLHDGIIAKVPDIEPLIRIHSSRYPTSEFYRQMGELTTLRSSNAAPAAAARAAPAPALIPAGAPRLPGPAVISAAPAAPAPTPAPVSVGAPRLPVPTPAGILPRPSPVVQRVVAPAPAPVGAIPRPLGAGAGDIRAPQLPQPVGIVPAAGAGIPRYQLPQPISIAQAAAAPAAGIPRYQAAAPVAAPAGPIAAPRPVGVPLPYVPSQFAQWLLTHPDRVIANPTPLNSLITSLGYGNVPIRRSYVDAIKLRNVDVDTREIQSTSSNPLGDLPAGLRNQLETTVYEIFSKNDLINNILHRLFMQEPVQIDPSVITPATKIEVVNELVLQQDASGRPSAYRYPRLIFTTPLAVISTLPYGLNNLEVITGGEKVSRLIRREGADGKITYEGSRGTPGALVVSLGGLTPREYSVYNNLVMTEDKGRALAYLLVKHPEIKTVPTLVAVNDILLEPFIRIKEWIGNLPIVLKQLADVEAKGKNPKDFWESLETWPIPHPLPAGVRFRLYNHDRNKLNVVMQSLFPIAIEDLYTDAEWNRLPALIQMYGTGKVKLVPNPYLLMHNEMVKLIATDRDLRLTQGKEAQELNNYDEIDITWSDKILSTPLKDVINGGLSARQTAYYLAVRGLLMNSNVDRSILNSDDYKSYLSSSILLIDAGGIGRDARTANIIYPKFIDLVFNNLSRDVINAVSSILGIEEYDLLTTDQIKDLFKRGYINPLPLTQLQLERLESWKVFTPPQQRMIANLYKIPSNSRRDYINVKDVYKETETYIKALNPGNVDVVIANLGMVVPHDVNKMEYVTSALPLYGVVQNRASIRDFAKLSTVDQLPSLADAEILSVLRVQPYYRTRRTLLDQAKELVEGKVKFFIPRDRQCKNKMTLDKSAETTDPTVFLVAYGKISDYTCYTLGNLLTGFKIEEENVGGEAGQGGGAFSAGYRIMDPKGIGLTFIPIPEFDALELKLLVDSSTSKLADDINKLQEAMNKTAVPAQKLQLRTTIAVVKEDQTIAIDLIKAIDKVSESIRGNNEYDRVVLKEFNKLSRKYPDTRPLIKQFLLEYFYLGMYMRRWKGPGNPYPYKKAETVAVEGEGEEGYNKAGVLALMTPHVAKVNDTLNSIKSISKEAAKFLSDLRLVKHHEGEVTQQLPNESGSLKNSIGENLEYTIGKRILVVDEKGRPVLNDKGKQKYEVQNRCVRTSSPSFIGSGAYYLDLFYGEKVPDYDITKVESMWRGDYFDATVR